MKFIQNFLLHPATIFLGMGIGIYIGLNNARLATVLSPLGEIYLNLMKMCVLPIMITAVISSLGRLFSSKSAKDLIQRLILVFVIGLLVAGAVGLGVGLIGDPGGHLDEKTKIVLSKEVANTEIKSGGIVESREDKGMLEFIRQMIPTNVFNSISLGKNLPILFFCVVLGVALGLLRSNRGEAALRVADAIYEAMLKVMSWIMYGLPFGLCFLFANQIAQVGLDILFALLRLVILYYIAAFIMIILYTIIIWQRVGGSLFRSLVAIKDPLIIALGTQSSLAAIPSALQVLHKNLKLDKETTNLVIPLGISLNPHGNVLHFSIAGVFIAQLYGQHLGLEGIIILLVSSILAAIASSGAPGVVALTMLALLLEPLGLPVAVAIILLTAIDPIVDPILTMLNVHGNCAVSALLAKRNGESTKKKKVPGEILVEKGIVSKDQIEDALDQRA